MQSPFTVVRGVDPKLTEQFLLNQPSVVNASVWFKSGRMMANVTVLDDTQANEDTLLSECERVLGEWQTPTKIVLMHCRPKVA